MADAPTIKPNGPGEMPDLSHMPGNDQDMLWSQVWQLPVLLLGLGLLVIGVFLALPSREVSDFHSALGDVQLLLENDKLVEARELLDGKIKPRINEASTEDIGYFWQLYADMLFKQLYNTGVVGQHGVEAALPEYAKIVEYYGNALDKEHKLAGESLRNYVRSLVALGKDSQALGILDQMTGAQAAQRYTVVRDMIERRKAESTKVDQALLDAIEPLMTRFRADIEAITDKQVARQQEVWADGFQSTLMMDAGDPQGAIGYLLRRIQRLAARDGDGDLAPLIVKLAQAYQAVGDIQNAEQRYLHAQSRIKPTDDLNADILVGLGQLAASQSTGQQLEQALEFFREAEENYPSSSSAHTTALIGRADCEARLGDHAAAVHYFDLAVREMLTRTRSSDPIRKEAGEIINTQFERAVDVDEYDRAKDYLDVLALLEGKTPSDRLLLNLAATCEKIGDQRNEEAARDAERLPGQPPMSAEARRLSYQQAANYYAQAAEYYEQHAAQVTIESNEQHGESLWNSAQNYDRAQLWADAIRVYEQFILTRDGDPKRLRAIRNLAMAYMADRQYGPALDRFQQLIDNYPRSPETFSSLVSMARCQDELGQTDQAVQTLNQVIDDHEAITPDSSEYRQALIELGKLYHRMGKDDPVKYARAIELLTEAVQRYGQTEDGPVLFYLLADANRRSVPGMEAQIAATQSRAAQQVLESERIDRLKQAQDLYSQAISSLEAKRSVQLELDPVEQVYLRNAYFYQADCAYDRRVFEQAIQLYNTAANNYADDPASLIARVQIVNAYCELGQFQQAKVANDMARSQLERIPDSAFDDENLPMKREHWEDWLRWTSERNLFTSQASAGG